MKQSSKISPERIREMLIGPTVKTKLVISPEIGVSTGSTLLNLACTDHPDVGFLKGGYYLLVGDSASGKTWLSLSCMAETARNSSFKDYHLIYDDVEGGALMDLEYYFGKTLEERLEPPSEKEGVPVFSDTVESFYFHIFSALQKRSPFLYVLDSQDALSSTASLEKFLKENNAWEKGKGFSLSTSFTDGKAKSHSEHLRHVVAGLRKTGSILLLVSQTRDNLGSPFGGKTRSGGRALRFYAHLELWLSVQKKITREVRGKERTIGILAQIEVKKNRVTGKIGRDRIISLPIYYQYGIDDIGSCVEFLIQEGFWEKKGRTINAKDLEIQGSLSKIIQEIEEKNLEEKLKEVTEEAWRKVDEESAVRRKPRY